MACAGGAGSAHSDLRLYIGIETSCRSGVCESMGFRGHLRPDWLLPSLQQITVHFEELRL